MASWVYDMYIQLGFSPKAVKVLIREQGLESPERLQVLSDNNVDNICNVMRKNGDGMPDRGQQVSVIDQENLKLDKQKNLKNLALGSMVNCNQISMLNTQSNIKQSIIIP